MCRLLIAAAYLVLEQGLSGAWASVAVAPRLQSTGSVLLAHRFSCSLAREIFQDQGSNLCLQHWQTDYLPLSRQGSPAFGFLYNLLASLSIWLLKSYITWFRELRLSFLLTGTLNRNQRRQWHPTPVLLLGKSHRRRSLVGCSPWGR